MKTFVLVLALSAVALAASTDEDNHKKPEKIKEKNKEYDANLAFNWKGDTSWKRQFDAAFKPIVDFLNVLGFNGSLISDFNGQGGGDVSGHFRLSGKRGNGAKLSEASDIQSSGSDATTEASSSSAASKSGPGGFSVAPVSSPSGGKLGRGALP